MVDHEQIPADLQALATSDDLDDVLKQRHPDYQTNSTDWQVLIDAFEGGGGFRDGAYIWPFPRESQADYQRRQAAARYINYFGPLVDLIVRLLFTRSVRRTSNNADYNRFLSDVTGAGDDMTSFLKRLVALSLVSGHAGAMVDRTAEPITGPTKADDPNRTFVSLYSATSIADWSFHGPRLTSVKLIEAAPRPSITRAPSKGESDNYLLWTPEGWARFTDEGELLGAGTPNLGGLVPLVVLRASPTYESQMTGRPLCGDPNIIRAMFNRMSEEDQVLRDQAFSVMTVSIGPDGNVDRAREQLGGTIGTARALVVQGDVHISPDQTVSATIRENIAFLVEELYRCAHVRYSRDSAMSESGESIRLQHTELNEMLQGLARSLKHVEKQIARAWFAWQSPNPEAAERAFQAAAPEASYPDQFIDGDLSRGLAAWTEAIGMGLGPTMTKRIKKEAVRRIDADIPPAELQVIDSEIDAQTSPEVPTFPTDFGDPVGDGIRRGELLQ